MPKVYLGGKDEPAITLEQSDDLIAVRTRSGRSILRSAGPVPAAVSDELADSELVVAYPEAGVEVFRVPTGAGVRPVSERKAALRAAPDVRFAGGVLVDPVSRQPVLYTENIFVKFRDDADPDACAAVLREAGLTIKEEVGYATNAFFVAAPEGTGQQVFAIAERLRAREDVEYCHPELIRPRARKGIFPQQWHLARTTLGGLPIDAHANVEAAHAVTQGAGIVIAVIDDGFDIDHREFASTGKIVAPRDATLRGDDPRPKDPFGTGDAGENHGTACAGVACADGVAGASGVAPKARLMPIRLASGLGSQREAEAFVWAADKGADVISCSWGPPDGRWFRPDDPAHAQVFPLPASTRLAIDHAVTQGRGGKGCVILFAAGNGNEPVEHDGYASNPKVIAVAACNDRGTRSVYSDFGKPVWCAFPSNDFGHAAFGHPAPLTPGIWTTDRRATAGYNPGSPEDGDPAGDFTNGFGGTSSACPGAAGVAALVLAVNPELTWAEVKDILRRCCDRIDPQGGGYDADGHSPRYGHGRLNALRAVELARPAPRSALTVSRTFDAPIPDLGTVAFPLAIAEAAAVSAVTVGLHLRHGFVGDLVIRLLPPPALRKPAVVLHRRAGGPRRELRRSFDARTTPGLAAFRGLSCKGTWTLEIADAAAEDAGTLVSFSLTLAFPRPEASPARAATAKRKGQRR